MPKYQLVGQKFKIGDKVIRKNVFGSTQRLTRGTGTVYGVKTKENSRGSSFTIMIYNGQTTPEQKTHNIV